MGKYLAILGVITVGLAIYVGFEDGRYTQEIAQKTAEIDKGAASANAVEKHSREGVPDSELHAPSWNGWFNFFRWPNGTTAWAIILTLMAVAGQARESAKATQAMLDSIPLQQQAANAALLNAQAVINAERPWLLVLIEPNSGPMGGFTIHVKNKGRTPAVATAVHMGCVAVEGTSALPKVPSYGPGRLLQDRIVVADDAAWVIWFDRRMLMGFLGADFDRALAKKLQIFVFVAVFYRDLLNPSASLPHETRWVCLFELNDEGDAIHDIEGIGVPSEYGRYT
jgi:hypothetical protein